MEHSVIRPAEGADASIVLPPVLSYIVGAPAAPRAAVEALIEAAILALDTLDGDPDFEFNGDELDGTAGEDDFVDHPSSGPGCPISDPDLAADDVPCDEPDQDMEPEEPLTPDYGIDQTKPLPDAAVIRSDQLGLRQHLDRIRRTRCESFIRYGRREYRLKA